MIIKPEQFSKHLFWDVDILKVDLNKRKRWFINRVLEYGLINDWKLFVKLYGLKEIAEVAMKIKSLDRKSASFIATLSGEPKEKFLCYSIPQLAQSFWNF